MDSSFNNEEYDPAIMAETMEIKPVQGKKKKKKNKKRKAEAYNLGGDENYNKDAVQDKEDMIFTGITDPEVKEIQEGLKFKCSSCPFATDDNNKYKEHFKSDWHRFNSQRKAKNELPISLD